MVTDSTAGEAAIRTDSPVQRSRTRFPLVLRIFLLTASLIILVTAVAIGVTLRRAGRIASVTVNDSISKAAMLFKDFEKTRLRELALGAQTLGRDPAFAAYIQEAQS